MWSTYFRWTDCGSDKLVPFRLKGHSDHWVSPLVSGTWAFMADPLSPVGWEVGPPWIWECHCYVGVYLLFKSVGVPHDAGPQLTPGSALSRWFAIGQLAYQNWLKLIQTRKLCESPCEWTDRCDSKLDELNLELSSLCSWKTEKTDKCGTGENGFKHKKKKATTNKTNWSLKTERKHCWSNKTNTASVNVSSGT